MTVCEQLDTVWQPPFDRLTVNRELLESGAIMSTTTSARLVSSSEPQRGKIDDLVMRRLCATKLTNTEMRDVLDRVYDIQVTLSAITQWKKRHGYPVRHSTKERLRNIPWRVSLAHVNDRYYHSLQDLSRQEHGRELNKPARYRLAKFLQELESTGKVVHYTFEDGFSLVDPRPGIDLGVIREPSLDDHGNRIIW